MNFQKLMQDIKPHLIVLLAFFLIARVYYHKTFQGLSHKEDDVTQGLLKGSELNKYTDKDGEFPAWTNAIFAGMPSTLIKGKNSGNYIKAWNYLTLVNNKAYPFKILLLSFIGFYILMMSFKVKPLFAALAAVAYGFATYSISSVEAAHYTKVMAMGVLPAVIASMHWLFSGRYYLGGITLAFNMALQIYYFHYQITYYTIICLLIMGLYYVITLIQENKIKQLLIATFISIFAIGAGVASNITKIKTTSEFADNTMRGGNDMAKVDGSKKQQETGKNGLNRDYAFDWSYGKAETFTLLIPNFYGGSSREKLSKKSKFYEVSQNEEAINDGLPMYHGDLTFTSGPIYMGAIIIFLFILGLLVIKDKVKWLLLALTLVSFILGWGKHFSIINNFLFDYLPYYNKFRVPMMAFSIAQVTIPLIGFLGIKELYDHWQVNKKNIGAVNLFSKTKDEYWEMIKIAYYVVGGFCLLMALLGPSIVDMGGIVDEELKSGGNGNMISILKEDRGALLRNDAFRSFIYISLAFAMLWAWVSNKAQKTMAIGIIGALAAVDLIGVDWRYLSWDDFQDQAGTLSEIAPEPVDLQIMQDKTLHYRVLDLSKNPFNDNRGAAFHKMIGGYDPAKLSRYQDLISELISKDEYRNMALDMLNCKYLIGMDSSNRKGVIPRFTNYGNAWFVSELKGASDATLEMKLLKTIDARNTATFNSTFEEDKMLKDSKFDVDSAASAELVSYHPDTMNYIVNNANSGYLVFSEIWYDTWKIEIDGKPAPLNKVDYTLRGAAIPAGKHQIKLYIDKGENTTDNIEKGVSASILAGMILLILLWVKSYFSGKP